MSETIGCIGCMTHGLRDNALDLFEIWMKHPHRRFDFGCPEMDDIDAAIETLLNLRLEILGDHADEEAA